MVFLNIVAVLAFIISSAFMVGAASLIVESRRMNGTRFMVVLAIWISSGYFIFDYT